MYLHRPFNRPFDLCGLSFLTIQDAKSVDSSIKQSNLTHPAIHQRLALDQSYAWAACLAFVQKNDVGTADPSNPLWNGDKRSWLLQYSQVHMFCFFLLAFGALIMSDYEHVIICFELLQDSSSVSQHHALNHSALWSKDWDWNIFSITCPSPFPPEA